MEELKLCAVKDFVPVLELARLICDFAKPTPAPYWDWAKNPMYVCLPLLDVPEYDCFGNYGHLPMSSSDYPLFAP